MPPSGRNAPGIAFVLAQVGALAAQKFAVRVAELDLTPPQIGILRAIAVESGRSQQALSEQLGLLPSRVVAFVDELEARALVERRRNPTDRRLYALYLTTGGQALMRDIGAVAREHEKDMTVGLTRAERDTLAELLATIAQRQQLSIGVHPGYQTIGEPLAGVTPATAKRAGHRGG